jgi:FkbM family methyltransferase
VNLVSKLKNKLAIRFRRYILREPFLIEVERWFKDKGDETLRLDYPLTSDSVVFDVGGYRGDFAFDINKKYDCTVYIFEPVLEFYQSCVARFANNEKVICFNHGLASVEGQLEIGLADNASSFNSPYANDKKEIVQLRSIVDFIRELSIEKIDLLKVNIEGGEFDIIPAIIESSDIKNINYLQIQFHNFIASADAKRIKIRNQLALTHTEMWNYDFVWESWKLKGNHS